MDNNFYLTEDSSVKNLTTFPNNLKRTHNIVLTDIENKVSNLIKVYTKNQNLRKLEYFNDFFGNPSMSSKVVPNMIYNYTKNNDSAREPGLMLIIQDLITSFKEKFKKEQSNNSKIANKSNFEGIDNLVSTHNSFYKFLKILIPIIEILKIPEKSNESIEREKIQQIFKSFLKFKKYFERLKGLGTKGIVFSDLHLLQDDLVSDKLIENIKKSPPSVFSNAIKNKIKSIPDEELKKLIRINHNNENVSDFFTVLNGLDLAFSQKGSVIPGYNQILKKLLNSNEYKKYDIYFNYVLHLNELLKLRLLNLDKLKINFEDNNTEDKNTKDKKQKLKKYKKIIKAIKKENGKINFIKVLDSFSKSLKNLNLSDEQMEDAIYDFINKNQKFIIKEFFKMFKENKSLLTEARLPTIRWRKNPRLGLNKIVLTCKKGEYKKSLNRNINISGKKIKDVICLPENAKPAGERMKDRKASIKRWRTIKSKPGKMNKMKFKRRETRRQSKTIRKET